MTAIKRRFEKEIAKQTQINFGEADFAEQSCCQDLLAKQSCSKAKGLVSNRYKKSSIKPITESQLQCSQFESQLSPAALQELINNDQGGNDASNSRSTPYRSEKRVNRLLNQSNPSHIELAQVHINTRYLADMQPQSLVGAISNKKNGINLDAIFTQNQQEYSKPSSITTACTYPNEMSASKSVTYKFGNSVQKSKRGCQTSNGSKKESKRTSNDKTLVGQKRPAILGTDQFEYLTKLNNKIAKLIATKFMLRNKKTGELCSFALFDNNQIPRFKDNAIVTNFDLQKLEVEYDYDTDNDQKEQSKSMLLRELNQAIDFYVQEDPLKLVDNVCL